MQSISMAVPLLYRLHFWFSSNPLPPMQWWAQLMEVNSIHRMNFHCLIVINWNLIVSKIWTKLNDNYDRNNSLQNFFFCKSFAISRRGSIVMWFSQMASWAQLPTQNNWGPYWEFSPDLFTLYNELSFYMFNNLSIHLYIFFNGLITTKPKKKKNNPK